MSCFSSPLFTSSREQQGRGWQTLLPAGLGPALERGNSHRCHLPALLGFSHPTGAVRNQGFDLLVGCLCSLTELICLLNFNPLFIPLAPVQLPGSVSDLRLRFKYPAKLCVLESHTGPGNVLFLLFRDYICCLKVAQNMALGFFSDFLLKLRKNLCPDCN